MRAIRDFFVAVFNWIFQVQVKPVKIGGHCYMPLFYNISGSIKMSWDYLRFPDSEKKLIRKQIKAGAASGETPAICFCLTPEGSNGGLMLNNMLSVSDDALDWLELECKALVRDGIAVFPCLYVDDSIPRWWDIEKHAAIWTRVHGRICKYVTGYILSIETNEAANSKAHIEGCINAMRAYMPGVAFYGTHLQWKSGGQYSWTGGSSTPTNANIILAEYSWNPHNNVGIQAFKNQYNEIVQANLILKWVSHEYCVDFGSAFVKEAKKFQRAQGAWGVG